MESLSATIWIAGIALFFAICVWGIIKVSWQLERKDQRRGRRDLDESGGGYVDIDTI